MVEAGGDVGGSYDEGTDAFGSADNDEAASADA